MATDPRSRDRFVNVTFRVSEAERASLREQALRQGYASVQQLLEARMLGAAKPKRKPGPQPQTERLEVSA
jgi:hypothetical protein